MQASQSPALVLIADDNPQTLDIIARALAVEGLDVAAVSDGEELLEMTAREEPDLILLDALMPILDGFETCKRLKANPATRDIPVIFMTSLSDAQHRIQGLSVGAVDYVTKPFEPEELLARVRTHISLRYARRAAHEQNVRLSEQIEERKTAERALAEAMQKLERRTEELHEANAQLSQELSRRELAETARAALQEQIIAVQRERLIELSTPLIPITDEILVMPLIGTLTAEQTRQVIAAALRGASERSAGYLIIDITGVKVIDEAMASMLCQAAKGLALLGTRAIITGVSPQAAKALVQLALPEGALVTKASLQAGVEHALRTRTPADAPRRASARARARA